MPFIYEYTCPVIDTPLKELSKTIKERDSAIILLQNSLAAAHKELEKQRADIATHVSTISYLNLLIHDQ